MVEAKGVEAKHASLPLAIGSGFDIKLPIDEAVVFHGRVSLDAAGGPGVQMLYPGIGGLGGLLAGIATHGVLVEAGKENEKARIQRDADKVIDPYRGAINSFTFRQLAERAIQKDAIKGFGRLINTTETGIGFVIKSEPVFLLTADRRALVLENTVSVFSPNSPTEALYQNIFKVVSDPRNSEDMETYWGKDGARELKGVSQALFSRSLNLAVATIEGLDRISETEKTIRFYEGGSKQIERGRVIDQACGRLVALNLRGWIISVPISKSLEETSCDLATL
jgi:hypothetical protein